MQACGKMIAFNRSPYRVISSIITIWAFIFNIFGMELAWATNSYGSVLPASGTSSLGSSGQFFLSNELGEIKYTDIGTNGKTVFYIQDAHCMYSCQRSIANIIEYLNNEHGVDFAALEGGEGNYDLSLFTDIEDIVSRERVTDYFVKEGRVNGAEYFAINSPGKITLKGLEKGELYSKNLYAYRESLKNKTEIDDIIGFLAEKVAELKKYVYSEELSRFEEMKKSYEAADLGLREYIDYLAKASGERSVNVNIYETISRITLALKKEADVDFKVAGYQRADLIKELGKKLSKSEVKKLVTESMLFKAGKQKPAEFYSYLFKKSIVVNIDIEREYPTLSTYKEYIDAYDSVDKNILFSEIASLEKDIRDKLCVNQDQSKLYRISGNLDILKDLFGISLTPDNYKYYRKHKQAFKLGYFLKHIKRIGAKYGVEAQLLNGMRIIDKHRQVAESFYKIARKRDNAFVKNITSYLKDRDAIIAVTGGFHAENLRRILKEKGYSFIGIMPRFEMDNECPYFEVLSGGLLKEEKIVREAISSLAVPSMFSQLEVVESTFDELGVPVSRADIRKLAVLLKKATDEGKSLLLEIKDPDGKFSRRRTIAIDGEDYVITDKYPREGQWDDVPAMPNLARSNDQIEAVEITLSTTASIRPITESPHEEIVDKPYRRRYENPANITPLSEFSAASDNGPTGFDTGEEIMGFILSSLRQMGRKGRYVAGEVNRLYRRPGRVSADGNPVIMISGKPSRINLVLIKDGEDEDALLAHAGGMGINIPYREGMTGEQIAYKLLHEAMAGCVFGDPQAIHSMAMAITECVAKGRIEDATKILDRAVNSPYSLPRALVSSLRESWPRLRLFGETIGLIGCGACGLAITGFASINGGIVLGLLGVILWNIAFISAYGVLEHATEAAKDATTYKEMKELSESLTDADREKVYRWALAKRDSIQQKRKFFVNLHKSARSSVYNRVKSDIDSFNDLSLSNDQTKERLIEIIRETFKGDYIGPDEMHIDWFAHSFRKAFDSLIYLLYDMECIMSSSALTLGGHFNKPIWRMTVEERRAVRHKRDYSDDDEVSASSELDKIAIRIDKEERGESGALFQNRQDVFTYFEHVITKQIKIPAELNVPMEILDLHTGLNESPEWKNSEAGFRPEPFIDTLCSIFGYDYMLIKGEPRATLVLSRFIEAFLDHYVEGAQSRASLDEPVDVETLRLMFRSFLEYGFSEEAFYILLRSIFGSDYFVSGRNNVVVTDIERYRKMAEKIVEEDDEGEEYEKDSEGPVLARKITRSLDYIVDRVISSFDKLIYKEYRDDAREMLLRILDDPEGLYDTALAAALLPYVNNPEIEATSRIIRALRIEIPYKYYPQEPYQVDTDQIAIVDAILSDNRYYIYPGSMEEARAILLDVTQGKVEGEFAEIALAEHFRENHEERAEIIIAEMTGAEESTSPSGMEPWDPDEEYDEDHELGELEEEWEGYMRNYEAMYGERLPYSQPPLTRFSTIHHLQFGQGRIISIEGVGENMILRVRFHGQDERLIHVEASRCYMWGLWRDQDVPIQVVREEQELIDMFHDIRGFDRLMEYHKTNAEAQGWDRFFLVLRIARGLREMGANVMDFHIPLMLLNAARRTMDHREAPIYDAGPGPEGAIDMQISLGKDDTQERYLVRVAAHGTSAEEMVNRYYTSQEWTQYGRLIIDQVVGADENPAFTGFILAINRPGEYSPVNQLSVRVNPRDSTRRGTYVFNLDESQPYPDSLEPDESTHPSGMEPRKGSRRKKGDDLIGAIRRNVGEGMDLSDHREERIEAGLKDMEPLSERFTRTVFKTTVEERRVRRSIVSLLSDAIDEYAKDPSESNKATLQRHIWSKMTLLKNLKSMRSFKKLLRDELRNYYPAAEYLSSESFHLDVMCIEEYARDLEMYGFDRKVVAYVIKRLSQCFRDMAEGAKMHRDDIEGNSYEVSEIIHIYMERIADGLFMLQDATAKTRKTCSALLSIFDKYYMWDVIEYRKGYANKAATARAEQTREQARRAEDAAMREIHAARSPGLRMEMVQAQEQIMTHRLEQRIELALHQTCEAVLAIDNHISSRVEAGIRISDDELDLMEEELRERMEELFRKLRESEFPSKVETGLFDDALDKIADSVVGDTRRRVAIRLSRVPKTTDLRTQRMADIARNNLRLTDSDSLFFMKRNGTRLITYDLLYILKHFSLAPVLFGGTEDLDLAEDAVTVINKLIESISQDDILRIITDDAERFMRAVDDVVRWVGDDDYEEGSLKIAGTDGSELSPETFVEGLTELRRLAEEVALHQGSLSDRTVSYTRLYEHVVRFLGGIESDMGETAVWTELVEEDQKTFYSNLKGARELDGVTYLGPELDQIKENKFARFAILRFPKSEICQEETAVMSVGGDFHSWMISEAVSLFADRSNKVLLKADADRIAGEVRVIRGFIFKLGSVTKAIVLDDRKAIEKADEEIIRALGIKLKDIVYGGQEGVRVEDLFGDGDTDPEEFVPNVLLEREPVEAPGDMAAVMVFSYRGQALVPRRIYQDVESHPAWLGASVITPVRTGESSKDAALRGLKDQWGITVTQDEVIRFGSRGEIVVGRDDAAQHTTLYVHVLSEKERLSPNSSSIMLARYVWLEDFMRLSQDHPDHFSPTMREILKPENSIGFSIIQDAIIKRHVALFEKQFSVPCTVRRHKVLNPECFLITQHQIFESHLDAIDIDKLQEGSEEGYKHTIVVFRPGPRAREYYLMDGHHRAYKALMEGHLVRVTLIEASMPVDIPVITFGGLRNIDIINDKSNIMDIIERCKGRKRRPIQAARQICKEIPNAEVALVQIAEETGNRYAVSVAFEALANLRIGAQMSRIRDEANLETIYPAVRKLSRSSADESTSPSGMEPMNLGIDTLGIGDRYVPVTWLGDNTVEFNQWETAFEYQQATTTSPQGNRDRLQRNIVLILNLLQSRFGTEDKTVLFNLGSGYAPLNDFEDQGITAINIDREVSYVSPHPSVQAEQAGAKYANCDIAELPDRVEDIKSTFIPDGRVRYATLSSGMMYWLRNYASGQYGLAARMVAQLDSILTGAWTTLDGEDGYLIVTEPGCEEFIKKLSLFADGLSEVIVIGNRKDRFTGAKAVIFKKAEQIDESTSPSGMESKESTSLSGMEPGRKDDRPRDFPSLAPGYALLGLFAASLAIMPLCAIFGYLGPLYAISIAIITFVPGFLVYEFFHWLNKDTIDKGLVAAPAASLGLFIATFVVDIATAVFSPGMYIANIPIHYFHIAALVNYAFHVFSADAVLIDKFLAFLRISKRDKLLSLGHHFRVGSIVRSKLKIELMMDPEQSKYTVMADETQVKKITPDDPDYTANQKRIEKLQSAIALLRTKGRIDIAGKLGTTTTILGLETRTHLIFSDPANKFYLAAHIGRKRNVIYLTLKMLDRIDIASLATLLHNRQAWIDKYNELTERGATVQELHAELGFYLSKGSPEELKNLREFLRVCAHEDAFVVKNEIIPGIGGEWLTLMRLEIEMEKKWRPYKKRWAAAEIFSGDVVIDPNERLEYRAECVELANRYSNLSGRYETIGNMIVARELMEKRIEKLKDVQKYDTGEFPVNVQERIVYTLLREGMLDEFLVELKVLLTGTGFPRHLTPEEEEWRKGFLAMRYDTFKVEVLYLLRLYRAIVNLSEIRAVGKAYREAVKAFGAFESVRAWEKLKAAQPKSGDAKAEESTGPSGMEASSEEDAQLLGKLAIAWAKTISLEEKLDFIIGLAVEEWGDRREIVIDFMRSLAMQCSMSDIELTAALVISMHRLRAYRANIPTEYVNMAREKFLDLMSSIESGGKIEIITPEYKKEIDRFADALNDINARVIERYKKNSGYPTICGLCSKEVHEMLRDRGIDKSHIIELQYARPGSDTGPTHQFNIVNIAGVWFVLDYSANQLERLDNNNILDVVPVLIPLDAIDEAPDLFPVYRNYRSARLLTEAEIDDLPDLNTIPSLYALDTSRTVPVGEAEESTDPSGMAADGDLLVRRRSGNTSTFYRPAEAPPTDNDVALPVSREVKETKNTLRMRHIMEVLERYPDFGVDGFTASDLKGFLLDENLLESSPFADLPEKRLSYNITSILKMAYDRGFLERERSPDKLDYSYYRISSGQDGIDESTSPSGMALSSDQVTRRSFVKSMVAATAAGTMGGAYETGMAAQAKREGELGVHYNRNGSYFYTMRNGKEEPFFTLGSAEQNTGNRHVSDYYSSNYIRVVKPIEDVAKELAEQGNTTYKIYLPPNNPTSRDFKELKALIKRVHEKTGMRAVVMHFAGLYSGYRGRYYLANPTPTNLRKIEDIVAKLARELKECGEAVAFVQLSNENDYHLPGPNKRNGFGDNAWDKMGFTTPVQYYEFMNRLAAAYKKVDSTHLLFMGHGGLSEEVLELLSPNISNYDGLAMNLYPNWNAGIPARRVMSANELDGEFGYHIRLAARLGKGVVVSEFGESSTGPIGPEGQAEFARNATEALSRYMAGNKDPRYADYPKILMGAIWHERVGELWKNRDHYPSASGLGLYDNGRPKQAVGDLFKGFKEQSESLYKMISEEDADESTGPSGMESIISSEEINASPDETTTVLEYEYTLASFKKDGIRYLRSCGATDCTLVTLYDEASQAGVMAHIPTIFVDIPGTFSEIFYRLRSSGVDVEGMVATIIGSNDETPQEILTAIEGELASAGIRNIEKEINTGKRESAVLDLKDGRVYKVEDESKVLTSSERRLQYLLETGEFIRLAKPFNLLYVVPVADSTHEEPDESTSPSGMEAGDWDSFDDFLLRNDKRIHRIGIKANEERYLVEVEDSDDETWFDLYDTDNKIVGYIYFRNEGSVAKRVAEFGGVHVQDNLRGRGLSSILFFIYFRYLSLNGYQISEDELTTDDQLSLDLYNRYRRIYFTKRKTRSPSNLKIDEQAMKDEGDESTSPSGMEAGREGSGDFKPRNAAEELWMLKNEFIQDSGMFRDGYPVSVERFVIDNIRTLSASDRNRMADIGCSSDPHIADKILTTFPDIAQLRAVDIFEERYLSSTHGNRLLYHRGRAQDIGFRDDSISVYVSTFAMEYTDLDQSIEELDRILDRNGTALLAFHHPDSAVLLNEGMSAAYAKKLRNELNNIYLWVDSNDYESISELLRSDSSMIRINDMQAVIECLQDFVDTKYGDTDLRSKDVLLSSTMKTIEALEKEVENFETLTGNIRKLCGPQEISDYFGAYGFEVKVYELEGENADIAHGVVLSRKPVSESTDESTGPSGMELSGGDMQDIDKESIAAYRAALESESWTERRAVLENAVRDLGRGAAPLVLEAFNDPKEDIRIIAIKLSKDIMLEEAVDMIMVILKDCLARKIPYTFSLPITAVDALTEIMISGNIRRAEIGVVLSDLFNSKSAPGLIREHAERAYLEYNDMGVEMIVNDFVKSAPHDRVQFVSLLDLIRRAGGNPKAKHYLPWQPRANVPQGKFTICRYGQDGQGFSDVHIAVTGGRIAGWIYFDVLDREGSRHGYVRYIETSGDMVRGGIGRGLLSSAVNVFSEECVENVSSSLIERYEARASKIESSAWEFWSRAVGLENLAEIRHGQYILKATLDSLQRKISSEPDESTSPSGMEAGNIRITEEDAVMEPSLISDTADRLYNITTYEASVRTEPSIVGIVLYVKPGEDVDLMLEEKFANVVERAFGSRANASMRTDRGIAEYEWNGVTYLAYIDDGTDGDDNIKRLERFAGRLGEVQDEQVIQKKNTFVWLLSDNTRLDNDGYVKKLRDIAYLTGLSGDYIPVSWQMFAGPLFADYIASVSDADKKDGENIAAIIDMIIDSVRAMTGVTGESKELDRLRAMLNSIKPGDTDELDSLFNGINLILDLPDINPRISELDEYRKIDKEVMVAL